MFLCAEDDTDTCIPGEAGSCIPIDPFQEKLCHNRVTEFQEKLLGPNLVRVSSSANRAELLSLEKEEVFAAHMALPCLTQWLQAKPATKARASPLAVNTTGHEMHGEALSCPGIAQHQTLPDCIEPGYKLGVAFLQVPVPIQFCDDKEENM